MGGPDPETEPEGRLKRAGEFMVGGRRARGSSAGILLAGFLAATLPVPAAAQIRDAVYRGTLVCGKLPFLEAASREAFDVSVTGTSARYAHVVRDVFETSGETGSGTIDGQNILLTGGWRGKRSTYEARYTGTFVRRSVNLKGTQTWTHDGKVYTRTCSGAIKRPFAIFLPRTN
jgi:hypothetical protein